MTDQSVPDYLLENAQMSTRFLDPKRPLTTCSAQSCDGCPVGKDVHCHFHGNDLAAFLLVFLPSFFVGGVAMVKISPWWLVPWIAIIIGYFGLVEIRVMCSHCPHYAEPGKNLQCWANYGSPRLWKYHPGPMSTVEKIIFEAGLILIFGYPLIFLVIGMQWLLLAVYALTSASFYATLKHSYCSQCMNFACPLNHVSMEVREAFFARNPVVSAAWNRDGK
jgi:hypothetical protein